MRRLRIGVAAAGLVVSLVGAAASCGANQGSADAPPAPSVHPSSAPSATTSTAPEAKAPPADLNDPKQVKVSAWTDEVAISALAKDCRWDPAACVRTIEKIAPNCVDAIDFWPDGEKQPEYDTRVRPAMSCKSVLPLACAQVAQQSCAPDGCAQTDQDCYPRCDSTCVGCADKCVSSCESCKSGCSDDACRLACAKSCGECRQGCLKALDHCATATCAEEMDSCFKTRDDQWMKTACPKVCPKVEECAEKCPADPSDPNNVTFASYRGACAKACMKRFGKGCPDDFFRICTGEPNAGVAFYEWHSRHHPDD